MRLTRLLIACAFTVFLFNPESNTPAAAQNVCEPIGAFPVYAKKRARWRSIPWGCRLKPERLGKYGGKNWKRLRYVSKASAYYCGKAPNDKERSYPTHLVDTIFDPRNIIEVTLGEKKYRYMPILITDKFRKSWSCYRIKVRNACVGGVKADDLGNKIVKLAISQGSRGATYEEVVILKSSGKLVYSKSSRGWFFLVPVEKNGYFERYLGEIKKYIRNFRCKPGESKKACAESLRFGVEWKVALALRIERRRPHNLSWREERNHHKRVERRLGSLTDWQQKYHAIIKQNESGTISPLQTWDAVLANSGISFGTHQWDIGSGDKSSIETFDKITKNESEVIKKNRALVEYLRDKCFQRPLRTLRVRDLKAFYSSIAVLDKAFQTQSSVDIIAKEYKRYLEKREKESKKLSKSAAFKKHKKLQFLVSDVENQWGFGVSEKIKRMIVNSHRKGMGYESIGCRLHDYLLFSTSYGKSNCRPAKGRIQHTLDVSCRRSCE